MSSVFPHLRSLVLCSSLLAAATGAQAGLIAYDSDVPSDMNGGGTADDPALYILGLENPTHLSDRWAYVGIWETNYNHLIITSGSSLTSESFYVGSGDTTHYNQVNVIGAGSSLNSTDWAEIGSEGTNNHVSVEDGAQANFVRLYVGNAETATHNSLSILGTGSSLNVDFSMTVGSTGSHNRFYLGYGATANIDSLEIGSYDTGNHNGAVIFDRGSVLTTTQLMIGPLGDTTGNSLTIQEEALVVIRDYWSPDYALLIGAEGGNYINFNGGYLAIEGDMVDLVESLIADGAFRYWDGSGWVVGDLASFTYGHFINEADAFAFTGYEGLAGYTIVKAAMTNVPEPAGAALVVALGAVAFAASRRRRR